MTRPALLFLLCGLLLAALSAPVLSGQPQEPAAQEEESTKIEEHMKTMSKYPQPQQMRKKEDKYQDKEQ